MPGPADRGEQHRPGHFFVLRSDGPHSVAVVNMLKSLKMHGMAQAVGGLTEQGSPAFEAAIPILPQVRKAETAEREVRSVANQLKAARARPTSGKP